MTPEWRCSVSGNLQEKDRMDRVEGLDKMLTNEKAADNKLGAGADEAVWIRSVSFVQWQHYGCFHCFLPGSLELLSPQWQFTKPPNIIHHQVKFSIICWAELCYQDPHKKIDAWEAEMMKVISFYVPPTINSLGHEL